MPPRGGTRGGRGTRASARGRGGSAAAAASGATPSIEELAQPASSEPTDGDAPTADALAVVPDSAITISSSRDSTATQSPAPAPGPSAAARARFRPKNIRRDVAERQRLQDQRDRDLAAKIKVEEKEQREADRRARRGGRGRGRGDMNQFQRRTVTGSGVFSGVSQDMLKQGGGGGGGGGGWSRGGGGHGGSSSAVKSQYGARYHNRREKEVRVNIDALRESAMPEASQNGSKPPGFLPVGITRIEHKAEDIKVATSAELEAEEQEDGGDDDLFVSDQTKELDDVEMGEDNEVWHAAPAQSEDDRDIQVKAEPGTEDEVVMDIDSVPAKVKAPPSPELQKKPVPTIKDAKAIAKARKREKALQDPEVQAMAQDTAAMLSILSLNEPAEKSAEEGQETDLKDGKLFLFQFPPILPPLLHLNADGDEVIELDDASGIKIKSEPGAPGALPLGTDAALPPGGGFVGKLNVRKSGKVELDWGGRVLDLGIAAPTNFYTHAIIVDEYESENSGTHGKATGMGMVYGKFVATPIFEEEEDWDPDLEALDLHV